MNIKQYIIKINELLSDNNFLVKLCNLSNNNPNIVMKNITKLINYYLLTGDFEKPIDIIVQDEYRIMDNILFIPFNTKFNRRFSLLGSTPLSPFNKELREDMRKLALEMGLLFSFEKNEEAIELEYAVYKAMKIIPFYNLFFENTNITPYIVGEKAIEYYKRVFTKKVRKNKRNVDSSLLKTLERVVGEFDGGKACLYVIKYPFFFRNNVIQLPNIIDIINICARNKGFDEGKEINLNNVSLFKNEENEYDVAPNIGDMKEFRYNRFELVTIDENFRYYNEALTGDEKKDLATLYGSENYHDNGDILSRYYLENIESIRQNNDILLRYNDGIYEIANGRHRIVYLKYFYKINSPYYQDERKDYFKRLFTIPVNVSHKIENQEFNNLINRLSRTASIIKTNILDDEPSIGIILDNCLYFINGVDELKELITELENNNKYNRYLYKEYKIFRKVNYNDILRIVYCRIGDRLFKISFRELLDILPNDVVSVINPYLLYEHYTMVINNHLRNTYFKNNGPSIFNTDYNKLLIDRVIRYLSNNNELLSLNIDELVEKIKEEDEFRNINDIELRIIIEQFGLNKDDNISIKKVL